MISAPFVELSIEKRNGQFFVLVVDYEEINEAGPFTKKQALKLHYMLALEAIKLGCKTAPIRKPKITQATRKTVACAKPVRQYKLSPEIWACINQ